MFRREILAIDGARVGDIILITGNRILTTGNRECAGSLLFSSLLFRIIIVNIIDSRSLYVTRSLGQVVWVLVKQWCLRMLPM